MGQGAIEIRSAADDSVVLSIDVASDAIGIDGHIVTVALPELGHDQSLYVAVQAGAFSDGSHGMRAAEGAVFTTAPEGAMRTVFSEDFEGLTNQLGAYVSASESGGDGTDWTGTAPEGWTQENDTPTGGPQEFHGWTFHDKASWIDTAADQGRSDFTLADGVVAVVDPDEYDDIGNIDPNLFDAALKTPEIGISGLKAGSLTLSFASSWMPEDSQQARLLVSYDGGEPVEVLNWSSDSGSANYKPAATNEQVTLQLDNPAGAQTAKVIFDMPQAGNDWWWAIDNIKMVGTDAPKAEIHGTAGNDRLIGTDGDDILFSDSGRSGFMTGGLGADVFTFNEVVDNGLRQTLTITDYEIGLDRIDVGAATVARYVERASGVTLMLEGDMDAVTVRGVSHYDDLLFV